MKRNLFILFLFISFFQTAYSQSDFWKNVKVRKAFETNTDDDDKASNLAFTFPKDKPNHFVINAGVGYEFFKFKKGDKFKNSFTGFYVYNKNNQIDKEQHNYKLGVGSNQVFYKNLINTKAVFGANTFEYLRDYIDSSHSVLFTSYWHPFSKKQKSLKLGGYTINNNLLNYYFLPQAGIEYQQILESKTEEGKGCDFRGFFSIGGSFLLKKKTLDVDDSTVLSKNWWTKGVELKVTYDGRYSLLSSLDNENCYVPMFKSELIFYPTQNNKFTIGLSYNNGANPIEGLAKQTFWLFTLKFKK